MTFVETDNLDDWELEHDAILDADGPVGVVERTTGDSRPVRVLLDCYLLGDARISAAAGTRLEERAHAL